MSKKTSSKQTGSKEPKNEKQERNTTGAQFGYEMRPGYLLRGKVIPEEGDDDDDFDL